MKKFNLILASTVLASSIAFAQNEVDAFRYSTHDVSGNARFMGVGGAMGALGNDFSALSINPAGISTYLNDDFNAGLNFVNQSSMSMYNGKRVDDGKTSLNLSSLGFVKVFNRFDGGRLSVGIGINNLGNYHNRYQAEGYNNSSSRIQAYQQQAQGKAPAELDPFGSLLAYNVYLLDGSGSYTTPINGPGQKEYLSIESSGGMSETLISIGGTLNDQVSLGFNLGFPSFSYEQNTHYRESEYQNLDTSQFTLRNFSQRDYLYTEGDGFNMKFGVILRPVNAVRIGLAVHSPSWYTVSDDYSTQISAQYAGEGNPRTSDSEPYTYNYRFTSPFKFNGSLALVSSKLGFLSFEYEWKDYSLAKFSSRDYAYSEENERIRTLYGSASNFKLGSELIFNNVALRGGFGVQGSPIRDGKSLFESNLTKTYFSAGLGFRAGNIGIDLSFLTYQFTEQSLLVYSTASKDNVLNVDENRSSVGLTMTYRF